MWLYFSVIGGGMHTQRPQTQFFTFHNLPLRSSSDHLVQRPRTSFTRHELQVSLYCYNCSYNEDHTYLYSASVTATAVSAQTAAQLAAQLAAQFPLCAVSEDGTAEDGLTRC